jgi:transcriptional regulator with GAF, ATPase, and Fis domain
VKVNCAAIPKDLVESHLFGHERGAFTGAESRQRGFFEQAHGGTLLLDEVSDLDIAAQAKVLRAVQSGEVSRLGSERILHVDVRVLCATNQDLAKAVQQGRFREDLFFRLAVFPIHSPPLRERMEDLPPLAEAFLAAFCKENGLKPMLLDPAALEALERRSWPGNVRELRNVIERAAILAVGDVVTIADLPEDPHASPFDEDGDGPAAPRARRGAPVAGRRATLREVLESLDWNISRAAVVLGIERTNLHKKIRTFDVKRGETAE